MTDTRVVPVDPTESEVKIYYMRDNHTFRRLPLDPFAAIEAMREERDEGHTYGMLCSKHPEIDTGNPITGESCIHAKGSDKWDDFELRAWPWLLKAYELSKKAPHSELAALEKQAAMEWAQMVIESDGRPRGVGWYAYWEEADENEWIRACTILEANGMLERHPDNADWVRIRSDEDG